MFKANWEKTSTTHKLPDGMVEQMVAIAYPDRKLFSYELIAGGWANLNFKIYLKGEEKPVILRIYLCNKDAAYIEQKIGILLNGSVPVPMTYYIGECNQYTFAITEFMNGIPLRDVLLGREPYDLRDIMYQVGVALSNITKYEFDKSGFFDRELKVTDELSDGFALAFAKECCSDPVVTKVLGLDLIDDIILCFEKYKSMFPDSEEKHLVHADFDPANILVDKIDDSWVVTGVLDWEFSFANSVLHDVANMLRYAHKMPDEFRSSFLKGLESGGVVLDEYYQIRIHILNLLSLIDCVRRVDAEGHPIRCTDIKDLISFILSELKAT